MTKSFIIAEAGVNHNGGLDLAHKLIDVAKQAGADAVKFQTWRTEMVTRPGTVMAEYQKASPLGNDMFEMGKRLELDDEDFVALKSHCERCGIMFLSTPFDIPSLQFLVREIQVPMLKISSGEAVNVPMLRAAACEGVPIILSTGMCTMDDVRLGVDTIQEVWHALGTDPGLTLMHCTTAYPTAMDDVHLRSMVTLGKEFGLPIGFSDHTEGSTAAVVAVALGACMIEKHFTLDRDMPGPDHKASADPDTLSRLISAVREAEKALGSPVKEPRSCEIDTARLVRRSLVATRDIASGEIIAEDALIALRPEDGIPARDIDRVIGRPAWRAFRKGEVLRWPG